jgi:chromosomal replication initiation ATPase DnaA
LLNAAAEARRPVLLAAGTPPARWPVRLPDLASRLRAMTAVELLLPDDDLLRTLLARLFADRQHAVSEPTQDWLLTHLPRTPTALRDAVDRLNRAALGSAGGITRPLARAELADLIDADHDAANSDNDAESTAETPVSATTLSSALPSPPTLPLL